MIFFSRLYHLNFIFALNLLINMCYVQYCTRIWHNRIEFLDNCISKFCFSTSVRWCNFFSLFFIFLQFHFICLWKVNSWFDSIQKIQMKTMTYACENLWTTSSLMNFEPLSNLVVAKIDFIRLFCGYIVEGHRHWFYWLCVIEWCRKSTGAVLVTIMLRVQRMPGAFVILAMCRCSNLKNNN